jgi:hypothetical protein
MALFQLRRLCFGCVAYQLCHVLRIAYMKHELSSSLFVRSNAPCICTLCTYDSIKRMPKTIDCDLLRTTSWWRISPMVNLAFNGLSFCSISERADLMLLCINLVWGLFWSWPARFRGFFFSWERPWSKIKKSDFDLLSKDGMEDQDKNYVENKWTTMMNLVIMQHKPLVAGHVYVFFFWFYQKGADQNIPDFDLYKIGAIFLTLTRRWSAKKATSTYIF